MKAGESPTAATFLYSLASAADFDVEVKPIDDSTFIVKADNMDSLQLVTQRLGQQGFSWVSFEDYLVNTTE